MSLPNSEPNPGSLQPSDSPSISALVQGLTIEYASDRPPIPTQLYRDNQVLLEMHDYLLAILNTFHQQLESESRLCGDNFMPFVFQKHIKMMLRGQSSHEHAKWYDSELKKTIVSRARATDDAHLSQAFFALQAKIATSEILMNIDRQSVDPAIVAKFEKISDSILTRRR